MPDPGTTAMVLGATSIVCGTVIAPLINYQIQKDRYQHESVVATVDEACNQLTQLRRDAFEVVQFVMNRWQGALPTSEPLAQVNVFEKTRSDADAIGVRLRIRIRENHSFYKAYMDALESLGPLEQMALSHREFLPGRPNNWFDKIEEADAAFVAYGDLLDRAFHEATKLYEDA